MPLEFGANHNGPFIAPVMDQFGWSQTEATHFLSIQPRVAALCAPLAGLLITRYNPRLILTAAVVVFGVAHLVCAFFTQFWQWGLYGVVYAASAAFWMYIGMSTMSPAFRPSSTHISST